MTDERVEAIRAVRLAAHELSNVCAAMVGGAVMALSITTVDTVGQPQHKIVPHPVVKEK